MGLRSIAPWSQPATHELYWNFLYVIYQMICLHIITTIILEKNDDITQKNDDITHINDDMKYT